MASKPHSGSRIYVLGAGFSRPAGLPLANDLYPAVRTTIESRYGKDTKFNRDLESYLAYCKACGKSTQTRDFIDLELLMSYLDIEHYLRLRGSDTWSLEGNESQLMIRKAIGTVIHRHTPHANRLPDFYYRFAEQLSVNDTVISLNYDLILEQALEYVGKPFRRYPYRYKSLSSHGGVIDSETEEVVLLKLHGSIDWFDDRQFLELKSSAEELGYPIRNDLHSVFSTPERYDLKPLVDGLLPEHDQLRHLHTIGKVHDYYESDRSFNTPFILSPSHVKFVYSAPVLSFWDGMGRSGGYNLGVSIIGFSLPEHDEYIKIGLYQMLSNYGSWWDEPMLGVLKDYTRFVDMKSSPSEIDEYLCRYRFADPTRARFFFKGFGSEAIDFLFEQRRSALSV